MLATASLPDSVVAAAEKSFFDAYCLNWLSTSLLPASRGSIRNRPLCATKISLSQLLSERFTYNGRPKSARGSSAHTLICSFQQDTSNDVGKAHSGKMFDTATFSDTFHSSTTLPYSRSRRKTELGLEGSSNSMSLSWLCSIICQISQVRQGQNSLCGEKNPCHANP